MTTISAVRVADSIGEHAPRCMSFLWTYPRWIHAEGRTHRRLRIGEEVVGDDGEEGLAAEYGDVRTPSPMEDPNLSRNASSSRALPVEKLIQDVLDDPAVPLYWGRNQTGMQAAEELSAAEIVEAKAEWFRGLGNAVMHARNLAKLGLHKQIVNRVLEPYSHIRVVVTATKWDNFMALRRHHFAEPHIRMLADATWSAMQTSQPKLLKAGEWHLPFVGEEDWLEVIGGGGLITEQETGAMLELSVARCASTSYKTVDGFAMTLERAKALYTRLANANPMHASPFEHQASPLNLKLVRGKKRLDDALGGNLGAGWMQLRKTLPGEEVTAYAP